MSKTKEIEFDEKLVRERAEVVAKCPCCERKMFCLECGLPMRDEHNYVNCQNCYDMLELKGKHTAKAIFKDFDKYIDDIEKRIKELKEDRLNIEYTPEFHTNTLEIMKLEHTLMVMKNFKKKYLGDEE